MRILLNAAPYDDFYCIVRKITYFSVTLESLTKEKVHLDIKAQGFLL